MKRIYNIHNIHTNDKLYCKEEQADCVIYHIFTLQEAISNNADIILNVDKCFSFRVPLNNKLKAFLYDTYTSINVKKTDSLYKLSESEYLDTYMVFIKNDCKFVYELPDKLIQDL